MLMPVNSPISPPKLNSLIKNNKKKTTSSYKLKAGDTVDFFNFVFKKNILLKKGKYIPTKKNLIEKKLLKIVLF